MEKPNNKKTLRDWTKYYKFALYVVIAILVALVGQNLFVRIDLTANDLYSLSKASKEAVSTLNEPLTINVFFSKNLPAPYNNIERYLHDLLEEYAVHASKYLSYRFFDVSAKEGDLSDKAEENRKKAQDYGIYPVNVQTIEQDEAKVQRAYMGIVFIHGDIIERIPAISSTEGLEYNITTTIKKMNNKISALLSLQEKIRVKLVQSSSLDAVAPLIGLEGLSELKSQVAEVVREQNGKNYDQLELVYIDPTTQELNEEDLGKYRRFGLQWPQFQQDDGTITPPGTGILALGMEFEEKSIETRLLSSGLSLTGQGLQEQFEIVDMSTVSSFIEENVDNLINIHEEIGYLSTHGTLSLAPSLPPQFQMMQPQTDSLSNLNTLLSKQYTVTQIDLTQDGISENIDTLAIVGPKETFSDWELFQIDQFLMKGKSLALFVETFNEMQPQQQQMYQMQQQAMYIPINSGLEKLLDHYGINVTKSYVMDESCYVSRDQQMGEMPIYFAPIIKNENINHSLDFLSNLKELIMIKTSPLTANEERLKENNLQSHRLFSSSNQSWEMAGQINLQPFMIRPPMNEEEKFSRPLSYLIEGEFPSYFADKPIPEKPEPETVEEPTEDSSEEKPEPESEQPEEKPETQESQIKGPQDIIKKGRPGKIFVIGTVDILRDNILDDQGQSPNAMFLLNTIDYLNDQEEIATMRSKNQRFNPLKDTKALTRTIVKILNIMGLAVAVMLLGLYVWIRRKAKRKSIQAMFAAKG
ncbi:MAG: hypothetical protein GQ544_06860 [Candidatus Aminicenantes bacterium]|nr:hypothetical protein [Candidatus Aminicenantes bacterium]